MPLPSAEIQERGKFEILSLYIQTLCNSLSVYIRCLAERQTVFTVGSKTLSCCYRISIERWSTAEVKQREEILV